MPDSYKKLTVHIGPYERTMLLHINCPNCNHELIVRVFQGDIKKNGHSGIISDPFVNAPSFITVRKVLEDIEGYATEKIQVLTDEEMKLLKQFVADKIEIEV